VSVVLYSNSSMACLLEQTEQQNVIIRHLIRGNAFTVVWGELLLKQHAVNVTGQMQVRIMKSMLQFLSSKEPCWGRLRAHSRAVPSLYGGDGGFPAMKFCG